MTDKQLYAECKKWGSAALQARWKFQGLLPEVYKRRLYKKKGYSCIYEFAARLAGMSRDQVDQVLRLEKRFEDKPDLKAALTEGKVSAHKLARIAAIATPGNQKELLEKTQNLSKAALDIFVKETKTPLPGQSENETKNHQVNQPRIDILQLDEDVERQLAELQQKGININDLLRKFLKEREQKIEQQMQKISREIQAEESDKATIGHPISRHVPIKSIKIITQKFGTKCSAPGCHKPAQQIHHEKPFAQNHTHDPQWLRPLCKGHHQLAHHEIAHGELAHHEPARHELTHHELTHHELAHHKPNHKLHHQSLPLQIDSHFQKFR